MTKSQIQITYDLLDKLGCLDNISEEQKKLILWQLKYLTKTTITEYNMCISELEKSFSSQILK
tara:strand:+ start:111 stop:299 length:189 start_codon:yes stop_codon:yes gene_type:complete